MTTTKLTAGSLEVTLRTQEGGISISGIRDSKTGRRFLSNPAPLFALTLRAIASDEKLVVGSQSGWGSVAVTKISNGAVIVLADRADACGITLTITASCENDKITWQTSLCTVSADYALFECDYIQLSFDCGANMTYFYPYGSGTLHDTTREEFSQTENYPSYGVAMEYLCFFDKKCRRGIYYGLHDPAPAYKKLTVRREKGNGYMTIKGSMPLTDIDVAGNSQSLCGKLVWQIFDGDWYDAALLYREWVISEAAWMPRIENGCRADIPDWFRGNSHWWRIRMTQDDSAVDTLLEAQEILGVPSCVHLYDWHKNPYDNDYPHYFPVKDAMPTVVKRLQDRGMKVMPYINGRLWDTRDRGLDDWQWSSVAKPGCTKDRNGVPFIETYSSKESDGSSVRLSIMCPSTAVWQEKVCENVRRLLYEYDVDGVYIDQIGAAAPYLCEDRGHSHRPGGGGWWCESYRNLLDHVDRCVPDRKIITTECNADPYTRSLDGFLTWLWVRDSQVPAFSAVYAGYVSMFGRHYDSLPADDGEGQKIIFVSALMFGDQMGWIKPEVFLGMPYRDFYVQCVRTRYELAEYFWRGTMLRPPVIADNGDELFTDKSKESPEHIIRHQATFSAAWERADGKRAYIFANACDRAVRARITCEGLADGDYTLSNGKKICFRGGKATTTISADTAIYFTV